MACYSLELIGLVLNYLNVYALALYLPFKIDFYFI